MKTSFKIPFAVFTLIVIFDSVPSANALLKCGQKNLPTKIQNFLGNTLSKSRQVFNRKEPAIVASALPDYPSASVYSSFLVPLLAGGAATAFADLILHPLDTIKTVQQSYVPDI